ncbi:MAG: hypothetical protein JXR86_05740 [Spirochaetales bacterium]|nr:hypothetical protein [Spirochaetales bacterium]
MLKKSLYLFAFLLMTLISCKNPSLPDDPDPIDTGGEETPDYLSVYDLIGELEQELISSGLTQADAAVISDGAKAAVGEDSFKVIDFLDNIVEGSVRSVGSIAATLDTTQKKMDTIDLIIRSVMTSIRTHKDDVMVSAARAIDPYAVNMNSILAQLAAASIRNLSTAGIPAADLDEAASETVKSLVSSLDEGGVALDDVPSAVQIITKSAVESISSNDTSSLTLEDALSSITSGAVSAVDSIGVEGFDDSMVADVIGGVTSGATEAIESVASDIETVKTLASTVTSSAITSASTLTAAVDVLEVTKKVTENAIKAVHDIQIDTIDTSSSNDDTNGIISSITQSAVKTAAPIVTLAGGNESDVQVAVVQSASEGAQTISSDYNSASLAAVIVVDSSGTTVEDSGDSDLTDAVAAGIAQAGNEPPVADAGANRSLDIDETTELNGSGSGDPDGSISAWLWWIASGPDDSLAVIDPDNVAVTSFTPDVAGLYTIGLKVTDTYDEIDTNFVQIACAIEAYEGLNVSQRIALAEDYYNDGDLETALAELNKVFSFYSQTNSWSQAYLLQGSLLWDLGRESESVASFNQVRTLNYDTEDYGAATRSLGWLYQWHLGEAGRDLDASEAYFSELLTDSRFANTRFTGDARHGLGFNHMMRDEFTEARTQFAAALADPLLSNNETYWSQFHLGESYLRESGDYTTAYTYWDVILAEPETYCLTDGGETDYWKIRNIYVTKADISWDNDDAAGAVGYYQDVLDYPGMTDDLKSWPARNIANYYRDLGDQYCDSGNNASGILEFETAEDYFNDAWTFGLGTEDGAWAYVSKNWMYRRWMEVAPNETEKAAVVSSFLSSCSAVLSAGYDRPEIQTRLNRAGYYHWMLDETDYVLALADHTAALTLAEEGHYPEGVWARYEIGNLYRDRAWDHHQETGVDWEGDFNTAISHYEQVTRTNYPVFEDWMEHFFADALADTANCYLGLGRFDDSINLLSSLVLDTDNYEQQDRAWFQFDIGFAYWEMGNYARDEEDYSGSIDDNTNAITELGKAITLSAGTGDEQRITDESNLRIGDSHRHSGYAYEDMDNESSANTQYTEAIPYYELVSDLEYWIYFEANESMAECYVRSGSFQVGIDQYQFVIDSIADNDEDINRMLFEIADAYRDKYYQTEAASDYTAAINAYNDVLAIAGLSGERNADVLLGKGRLITDYAFITYRDQGVAGPEFENLMDEAIAAFEDIHSLTDDFDWWGDARSEAFREAGNSYRDKAFNYRDYMGETSDISVIRGYLQQALTAFESAMDRDLLGNIDEGNYNDAKRETGWVNFDIAYTYDLQDSTAFTSAEPYIIDGMDLGFEVLADSEADADLQADILNAFGSIHIEARGQSVTLGGGPETFSLENAVFYFGLVIANYSSLDNGRFAAEAQTGIGRAYRQDGNDSAGVADFTDAIVSYEEAIVQYDLVEATYASLPDRDQWLIENAQFDCIDTHFELAEAQVDSGDTAGAIATLQEVVDRNIFRVDDANNRIDELENP